MTWDVEWEQPVPGGKDAAWVAVVREVLGPDLFPKSGLVLRITVEASGRSWGNITAAQRNAARDYASDTGLLRLPVAVDAKEAWVCPVPGEPYVYVDRVMHAHLAVGGTVADLPADAYPGWEGSTPDERRAAMYASHKEMITRITQKSTLSVHTRVMLLVAGAQSTGDALRGEDSITSLEDEASPVDRILTEEDPGYGLLHGAAAELRENILKELRRALEVLQEYPIAAGKHIRPPDAPGGPATILGMAGEKEEG
jgi:hypothetical protein